MVRAVLTNVQVDRDGLRNKLAAARMRVAQAVSDRVEATTHDAEAVPVQDSFRTELAKGRSFAACFTSVCTAIVALLNIFDSVYGKVVAVWYVGSQYANFDNM